MISQTLTAVHQEALRVHGLGYLVLPIVPEEKRPYVKWKHWQTQKQTKDDVNELFVHRPSAGLGIITTGCVVIDVDLIDGNENSWLNEHPNRKEIEAAAMVSLTPSGGTHLIFRKPKNLQKIGNSVSKLANGVDIRTDGGQINVWPTTREAGGYQWGKGGLNVGPEDLNYPPPCLEKELALIGRTPKTANTPPTITPTGITIPDGKQNDMLFRKACKERGQGKTEDEIYALLRVWNRDCEEPKTEAELDIILGSTMKYEPNDPVAEHASSLRLLSQGDLINLPEPSWLVDLIIPQGGLGIIYGEPGSGKSWLVEEISQSVARNQPLLGNPKFQPKKSGWVLVLLPESAPSWGKRTKASNAYTGNGLTDDIIYCVGSLNLAKQNGWMSIEAILNEETIMRGEPPTMVIIDTLSASIPGEDENLQSTMSMVTSHLSHLINQGVTVIMVHHPAKHTKTYRGSTVLLASCDWMLYLEYSAGVRVLKKEKLRDAEDIGQFAFTIEDTAHGPVAMLSDTSGPWTYFSNACMTDKELSDIFLDKGLVMPDGEARGSASKDVFDGDGVTLTALRSTWERYKPIPKNPRNEYHSEYGRRTTLLLGLARKMVDGRVLTVVSGSIEKGNRSERLKAVIKQVSNV